MKPAIGSRIRLLRFSTENTAYDDNTIIPPGTEGTVTYLDDNDTIFVRWDNGSNLGLLADQDEWETA